MNPGPPYQMSIVLPLCHHNNINALHCFYAFYVISYASVVLIISISLQIFENVSAFEAICIQCSTTAINSFRFKREIKENNQKLINMIELLNGSFENFPEEFNNGFKTLYITLNPELQTSSQYYDNIECDDIYSALRRYYTMSNYKYKNNYSISKGKESIKMENKQILNTSKTEIVKKRRKFTSKQKLETLEMLYNRDDLSNIQCKECLNTFQSFAYLRCHFIRMHAPKDYKCDECSKSFGSAGILSAHKMESHRNGLVCAECGKVFNHHSTLKMHEKSHYIRLMCQKCGRIYKNRNTYQKHIDNQICDAPTRRSQADAKFECDYCHKKYSQKMTLRVHIQYEHGNYKYLDCKWCNKKFWCKSRLNAHIVKHTKERNFTCTICNGKFVSKESLLYHTRIHTGECPYKCPHCECRFLNASRRAAHVRSRHMDPVVQCDLCQAKFKSHHFLHKHKKLHKELDDKSTDNLEKIQIKRTEKVIVKRGDSNRKVIFITDTLNSENIKLDLDGEETVELRSNADRTEYVYQYQFDRGQDLEQDQQIYLEVTDDDDVIKVSENIEV